MKLYTIYADTHEGAPHGLGMYEEMLTSEIPNTILLGDIIDIANVKEKKLDRWVRRIRNLEDRYGDNYVSGNHECKYKVGPIARVIDGIIFVHGHTIFWDEAKVIDWQDKDGGKGMLSRFAYSIYKVGITGASRGLDDPAEKKLTDDNINKICALLATNNCHTIVFGHTHKKLDIYLDSTVTDKEIRIVNVPRGKTEIRL